MLLVLLECGHKKTSGLSSVDFFTFVGLTVNTWTQVLSHPSRAMLKQESSSGIAHRLVMHKKHAADVVERRADKGNECD